MAVTSGNFYLNQAQMEGNVNWIVTDMHPRGWTNNALAGMLGNMQSESTINPGIWQNLQEGNLDGGFGLVQWTPASKYIDWAEAQGYADYTAIGPNVDRIDWELANGVQYAPTTAYPLTFQQFKVSTAHPAYLARAFLYNYERPESPQPDIRGQQAVAWYTYITGIDPGPEPPGPTPIVKNKPMKMIFYTRRRF